MKTNTKQRLFEVMQRLDPNFTGQQPNDNEQGIINDILAVSEGVSDWWNKFKEYGRKGLLTAAIIIAVAFSAQAQQQSSPEGVVKAGVEMAQDNQTKQDVYNFMIGAVLAGSKDNVKNGNMERFQSSSELLLHYMTLRNGDIPEPLSQEAKDLGSTIIKMYQGDKISPQLMKAFIADGQALNNFNYTQSGNNSK